MGCGCNKEKKTKGLVSTNSQNSTLTQRQKEILQQRKKKLVSIQATKHPSIKSGGTK